MAKENIARFLSAAMKDKELTEKVAALAADCGYGFTAEEWQEFGEARLISDAETESAAGAGPARNIRQFVPR